MILSEQVKPQIIVGNRMRGQLNGLLRELSDVGLKEVIVQDGYYDDSDSRTNIACAHKRCIIHAMHNDWPYAIIMEDDVWFPHVDAWRYFLDNFKDLPQDWDIYTSGFYSASTLTPEYKNLCRVYQFCGLHCYAVSSKFYEKFLKTPPMVNIDYWVTRPGQSCALTAYPFAAIQKAGFSENVGEYKDYSNLLIGKKIFTGFENLD